MPTVVLERSPRWVVARLPGPHRVVSWAVVGGGVSSSDTVAWHQVDGAELPPGVDPAGLLRARMIEGGIPDAVGLLTSRDLRFVHTVERTVEDVHAVAVVTAGFSNARRVGDAPGFASARAGTINVLCVLSRPLSLAASLEALSIATEARTAAVLGTGIASVASGQPATGTGTDCIVMATPLTGGDEPFHYAGKHTAVGSAVGATVHQATLEASNAWLSARRRSD